MKIAETAFSTYRTLGRILRRIPLVAYASYWTWTSGSKTSDRFLPAEDTTYSTQTKRIIYQHCRAMRRILNAAARKHQTYANATIFSKN